jgi:hypothetical protein
MNKYLCFFKGKTLEVTAATSYDAQRHAALMWGVGRRSWLVTVMLAQRADGSDVIHVGA